MEFISAFIIGGTICLIGQLLMDKCKLLPIHITVLFVFIGSILEAFNIYDSLITLSGAGALVPISSISPPKQKEDKEKAYSPYGA